jgi:hypothetical protein
MPPKTKLCGIQYCSNIDFDNTKTLYVIKKFMSDDYGAVAGG